MSFLTLFRREPRHAASRGELCTLLLQGGIGDLGLSRCREVALEKIGFAMCVELGCVAMCGHDGDIGLRLSELGAFDLGEHVTLLDVISFDLHHTAYESSIS